MPLIVVREERDRMIELHCFPNEEYLAATRAHILIVDYGDHTGPHLDVLVPPRVRLRALRAPEHDVDEIERHGREMIELAHLGRDLEREQQAEFEAKYTLPLMVGGKVYRRLSRSAFRVLREAGIVTADGDTAYVIVPAHTIGCVEQALAPYNLRVDSSEPLCDTCVFKYTLSEA